MSKFIRVGCIILLCSACATVQSKFSEEYLQYVQEESTRDFIPHNNDSTYLIQSISSDAEYGFTERKPVFLGVKGMKDADNSVEKYLNALRGPNGETLVYERIKACCVFKTPNQKAFNYPGKEYPFGMLEVYQLSYGENKIKTVYFNIYDEGPVQGLYGFSIFK